MLTIQDAAAKGYNHEVIKDILASMKIDYFCICDEIATTGMPHTHVFMYRKSAIRLRTVQQKFPSIHYDYAYGSCRENRDYLLKEGKWIETSKAETSVPGSFEEWGNIPDEREENDPDKADVIALVESGATTAEIVRANPKFAFKTNDINTLRETLLAEKYMKQDRQVDVTYIYGPTGVGKTRSIYAKHDAADICRITNYNAASGIKFDAYHGQKVLVFEEFNSQVSIFDMLNYLDRYPVILPARYSDRVACYSIVYLTSNIPLYDQYTGIQHDKPAVWEAFLRRINHVVWMTVKGETILK